MRSIRWLALLICSAQVVAAMRDIARVLRGKLQSENAAIALVDERRHNKFH